MFASSEEQIIFWILKESYIMKGDVHHNFPNPIDSQWKGHSQRESGLQATIGFDT